MTDIKIPEGMTDAAGNPATPARVAVTLRLPPALHSRLQAAAARNGVALNAYITQRLRAQVFDDPFSSQEQIKPEKDDVKPA